MISARLRGALRALFVRLRLRVALAIMPTSHAEVIIKSHCYVIMTAQFFAQKLVTIYMDWIALLRRLLIHDKEKQNKRLLSRAPLEAIGKDNGGHGLRLLLGLTGSIWHAQI